MSHRSVFDLTVPQIKSSAFLKIYYVACIPGHKEYLPEQQFHIKKLIT